MIFMNELGLVPVEPSFYLQDTVQVARRLIGRYIVRTSENGVEAAGRIVESEAYRQDDPASHSFAGPTGRTEVMFRTGGVVYVYLIYGIHYCFNVVTEEAGIGAAVLIRAIQPVAGLETIWNRRFPEKPYPGPNSPSIRNLCNGPGKLSQALNITRERDNGKTLMNGSLSILAPEERNPLLRGEKILAGGRIGISKATELPWRFCLANNYWVSRRVSSGAESGSIRDTTRSRSSIER